MQVFLRDHGSVFLGAVTAVITLALQLPGDDRCSSKHIYSRLVPVINQSTNRTLDDTQAFLHRAHPLRQCLDDNLSCKHIAVMTIATQVTAPTDGHSKFQRLYNFVGFKKRYNFTLCKQYCPYHHLKPLTLSGFIFAGALFGFTLARLMYLNISGVFCGPASGANTAAPGECYYYQNFNRYKIGIRLHLYTILREFHRDGFPFATVTDTPPSRQFTRSSPVHTCHSSEVDTRAPHQRLCNRLTGVDRQCWGHHDRSRSLWRNNGDAILDRCFVHLDYRWPRASHLQHQDATD